MHGHTWSLNYQPQANHPSYTPLMITLPLMESTHAGNQSKPASENMQARERSYIHTHQGWVIC
eukprot:scaffold71732_cov13-Tisochrysis_lutea.AAC.1